MAEKRSKTPGGTAKIKHDAYDEAVDAEEDFDADIDVGGSADLQGRQNVIEFRKIMENIFEFVYTTLICLFSVILIDGNIVRTS